MKPFPFFLTRIAGLPFSSLDQLTFEETKNAVSLIESILQEIETKKSSVCEALHELISTEADPRTQNQLLNLKRDIFNGRNIKANDVTKVQEHLTKPLHGALQEYLELQAAHAELKIRFVQSYKKEVVGIRDNLKKTATDANLRKGLLLSSQPLLNNLDSYIERDASTLRKKELKTEESLIKYVSRMSAKTSPFSTFTNLTSGKIIEGESGSIFSLDGKERVMKSHICLNNGLFSYLKGLFGKYPDAYRQFYIRPNSTIRVFEDGYSFLTNSNNIESFQKIPANPVVELFYELLKDKGRGIRYAALVEDIITNEYFDAEVEEIESYINQLVSYGFLEFNIGVSGIDPYWDKQLVLMLGEFPSKIPSVEGLIATLKKVRNLAEEYATGDLNTRRLIIKEAFESFRGACMEIHEAAGLPEDERKSPEELQKIALEKKKEMEKEAEKKEGAAEEEKKDEEPKAEEEEKKDEVFMHSTGSYFYFKAEQLFYEDTTVNIIPAIPGADVSPIMENVHKLLVSMMDFEGFRDEMEKMNQYFITKWGDSVVVDIMTFYEEFYRDVKKPEAEKLQKQKEQQAKAADAAKAAKDKKEEPSPAVPEAEVKAEEPKKEEAKTEEPVIKVTATEERMKLNKEWLTQFLKSASDGKTPGELLDLKQEQIKPFAKNEKYLRSYGCFAQVYRDNGMLKAVLNNAFAGYGKMFSRFLHILDPALTETLRTWNQGDGDSLMIENCDASFFNANLHPPLMGHEIWMPGGQNTLPAERQVPVTDLELAYNKEQERLVLMHRPTGKETYMFDLGFQGHKGRSQLFQLLSKFTLANHLYWKPLTASLNNSLKAVSNGDMMTVIPRITFEENVVLQRKTWVIKKEMLPVFDPNEPEEESFLKVSLWKRKLDLPDEAFVFLTSFPEMEMLMPEQMAKLGRDSYKPQYMSFNNPLLINLLVKMIEKVPVSLRIEEMSPGSSELLEVNGEKFVSEFVLQWYDNYVPSEKPAEMEQNSELSKIS